MLASSEVVQPEAQYHGEEAEEHTDRRREHYPRNAREEHQRTARENEHESERERTVDSVYLETGWLYFSEHS